MPRCKKPEFTKICSDIDPDNLYMTENPTSFKGKWKEACKKNKKTGMFKRERAWYKPDDYTDAQWMMMEPKKRGKIIKQRWEDNMKKYDICKAQNSYQGKVKDYKRRKAASVIQKIFRGQLDKRKTRKKTEEARSRKNIKKQSRLPAPPLPPPLPASALIPSPNSGAFPELPHFTDDQIKKILRPSIKKPPKPPPRKESKKLYTNKKPQLSPKTAQTWGNLIPSPRTPEGSPNSDSDDDWGGNSTDYSLPKKYSPRLVSALRSAVGKKSRKKRNRRKTNRKKTKSNHRKKTKSRRKKQKKTKKK